MLMTALLAAAAPVLAPPQVQRPPDPYSPPIRRPVPQRPVLLTQLDVSVRIEGPAARVTQELTLRNTSPAQREFDLVFPLGDGAVISGLELKIGGRTLEGRVFPAEEARRIYQDIVRKTRDPALLEHYGEALYRARIFPVPALGEQRVTLSYNLVLRAEGELHRLHVPLTAWRRIAGPFNLTLEGSILSRHPVSSLYSPTHELLPGVEQRMGGIEPSRRSTFRVHAPRCKGDEDFLAYFKARSAAAEGILLDVAVLSERPDPSEPGYFLAVVHGLPTPELRPEPKDVVFVLDRSGSMQGEKIAQAKAALKFLVERLGPEDRFNLVTYAAGVEVFSAALQAPAQERLGEVLRFIESIEASGGTNIEAALATALAQLGPGEQLNQIVFLTDGLPTVGERDHHKLAAMIRAKNLHGARIVSFGVGFDVNGAFLDRVATQNRGLSEYVLPSENIEDKVPGFYERIRMPLVRDATIELAGTRLYDVFPRQLSDIYGGHQTLICGRYTEPGDIRVVVRGKRGGAGFSLEAPAHLAGDSRRGSRDLVARLWASRKIGYLVDEIRLNGEAKELVDEIVRLGTRFGVLTEYTSFLAAEETDLLAFDDNVRRARRELEDRAGVETGSHGFAQASNAKKLQRADAAPAPTGGGTWLDESGEEVTVETVQSLGGKTFFLRGDTWQDSALAAGVVVEEIGLYSEEFFSLLDRHPWLNRCVARTGDVTLLLDGRNLRLRVDR